MFAAHQAHTHHRLLGSHSLTLSGLVSKEIAPARTVPSARQAAYSQGNGVLEAGRKLGAADMVYELGWQVGYRCKRK